MKIGTLFSVTKATIRNDADPFGEKPKFIWTQGNTKGYISKNMMKWSNWNSKEEEYKKWQ